MKQDKIVWKLWYFLFTVLLVCKLQFFFCRNIQFSSFPNLTIVLLFFVKYSSSRFANYRFPCFAKYSQTYFTKYSFTSLQMTDFLLSQNTVLLILQNTAFFSFTKNKQTVILVLQITVFLCRKTLSEYWKTGILLD